MDETSLYAFQSHYTNMSARMRKLCLITLFLAHGLSVVELRRYQFNSPQIRYSIYCLAITLVKGPNAWHRMMNNWKHITRTPRPLLITQIPMASLELNTTLLVQLNSLFHVCNLRSNFWWNGNLLFFFLLVAWLVMVSHRSRRRNPNSGMLQINAFFEPLPFV
jgi:hypothetical protein